MMYRVMDFLLDIAPRIVTFPGDMEKLANDFKQVRKTPLSISTAKMVLI